MKSIRLLKFLLRTNTNCNRKITIAMKMTMQKMKKTKKQPSFESMLATMNENISLVASSFAALL